MSNGAIGATGATGAAAAAAAIAQAVKASGAIVRVEPGSFLTILERSEAPLVVTARGGFLSRDHQYLSAYKGLIFFTKNREPLLLPGTAEVVTAEKIWVPG